MSKNDVRPTDKDVRNITAGDLLRRARKARDLTQKELATIAGTSQTCISQVENNLMNASYSSLKKIIETGLGGELELAIKF